MYNFAIVGAGRIAAGYDDPSDVHTLTHAHAISKNANANLVGFFDTSLAIASGAAGKWGGRAFAHLSELLAASPDVIVVCVPDPDHLEALESVLALPPSIVVCEKPLTISYDSSVRITEAYRERGVQLAVNYQRRFDPEVTQLKDAFESGHLGRLIGGTVYYAKGLKHNGSHAIDLLRFVVGEIVECVATSRRYDYTPDDPSVSGVLRIAGADIALIAGDERFFSIFEIDLLFERARYRFYHSGMKLEIQEPRADSVYPSYFELFPTSNRETGFTRALGCLVKECIAYLETGIPMRNLAATVLGTQRVCEALSGAPIGLPVGIELEG